MEVFLVVAGIVVVVFFLISKSTPNSHRPPSPDTTLKPIKFTPPTPRIRHQTQHPGTKAQPTRQRPKNFGTITGRCFVIDGDTIIIKRTKIRLAGIDAPELDQPWGQKSKWAMVSICKGKTITARLTGETSHDRQVATCFCPQGNDIGAELIKQGLALDWALFSGGKYRHLEQKGVRQKMMYIRRRMVEETTT